jgi:hypothetical protein
MVGIVGWAAPTQSLSISASPSARSAAKSALTLTSPSVTDGVLAIDATCDGEGVSPSLTWSDAPSGTVAYAVVMDHLPNDGERHTYLVAWGIGADARSLTAGDTTTGYRGANTVNPTIFGLENVFLLLFMIIIGGIGRAAGAVVGAVLLYLLPFVLSPLIGHHHALVFGLVMVLVVLFQPKGLMGVWDALVARRNQLSPVNGTPGPQVQPRV